MAGTNAHDDASTLRLLAAFDQTMADCNAAQSAVDSTSSYLNSIWKGQASAEFSNAISQWQDGLNKVKSALNMISGDMTSFHHSTGTTEHDSAADAKWMSSASWT
jgi:WXG100 family type VII secretion target